MNDAAEKSMRRGLDWLIALQAADGGWHSQTYGQLKDGASVTALPLYAASYCSKELQKKHSAAIERGFAFLEPGLAKRGTVASPDGSLDFPTYATALYLVAARRLRWTIAKSTRQALVNYLLGAQVGKNRGFAPDSPSFGGWDFLGPDDAQGITTGTNISVTRYVLETLASEGETSAMPAAAGHVAGMGIAREQGRKYVLRCQQADDGFGFTCEPGSLSNKAAYSDAELTKPRSYGTATCDGALALIACGGKPESESVTKAINWLAKRPGLEVVPGFEGLPPEDGWDRGLRYYYYSALSRLLPYFPLSDRQPRQQALAKHLVALQSIDGHWINESDRMRENDPLIATAFAIVALSATIC